MDAYTCIRTKRDSREYADRPLLDDSVQRILQAGRMAGSSKNTQPWRFVVLRDPARKQLGRVIATAVILGVLLGLVSASALALPPPGDVNLDGSVDTRDAGLVLQFDAGLTAALADPFGGDVNYDGRINSLDALLILQVDAALIPIDDLILPPTIAVTSVSGAVGERVRVQLEALDFIYYYLLRWSIDVPYDSHAVELQSCTPRAGSTCIPLSETSAVRVSGSDANGLVGDIILATIEFVCSVPGTVPLEPDIIELEASAQVEAGIVTCTSAP